MALLILGYGNVDREDDGIGSHVLRSVARRLGLPPLDVYEDGLSDLGQPIDLVFVLQLVPELAETIAGYDEVFFVDAHTGSFSEEIRWEGAAQGYVPSAFTHHLTPATLMEIARTLYGRTPNGHVVSVRGYRFGFGRELSAEAQRLCEIAAEQIAATLQQFQPSPRKGNPQDRADDHFHGRMP